MQLGFGNLLLQVVSQFQSMVTCPNHQELNKILKVGGRQDMEEEVPWRGSWNLDSVGIPAPGQVCQASSVTSGSQPHIWFL